MYSVANFKLYTGKVYEHFTLHSAVLKYSINNNHVSVLINTNNTTQQQNEIKRTSRLSQL